MPGQTARRPVFEVGASLELGVWALELVAWALSFSKIEMRPALTLVQIWACNSVFTHRSSRPRKSTDFRRRTPKTNDAARSFDSKCAVSSVVEHYLDTVGVRGSNPLSRTILVLLPARNEQWAKGGAEADGQEVEETITRAMKKC